MKDIKPIYTLFFLLAVLAGIAVISLIIPKEGIQISSDISIKAPSVIDIFTNQQPEYADISKIIEQHEPINQDQATIKDTIITKDNIDTVRADADKLKAAIHDIEFSVKGREKIRNFFTYLENIDSVDKVTRIWHYGDSQIEGERITGFIREKFQSQFGGYGPGFLEIVPVVQKPSWVIEASDNWFTYNLFGIIDSNVTHRKYGPLLKFFTFSEYKKDSLQTDSVLSASFTLKKSKYGQHHSMKYDVIRLFYGNVTKETKVTIKDNEDSIIKETELPITDRFSEYRIDDIKKDELKFEFTSEKSPDFYTVSLESKKGIIMDNIALRGSAGLDFTKLDNEQLKRLFNTFNVKLLIWEFGVNMVSDETEYFGFYKTHIKRQLKRIKEIAPELPVIVIGVSDRSKKEGTYYVSLESVVKVRNAQKEAAIESGYAFWDMYEAMGGKNSMPSWVFADPPLASEDFTHFNINGARIISNMFYNALMDEYKKYQESKID